MGVSCVSSKFVLASATRTVMYGSIYSCESFKPIFSRRRATTVPVTFLSIAWCCCQSEGGSSMSPQMISPSVLGLTSAAVMYLLGSTGNMSGSLPVKSFSSTGSRFFMSIDVMESFSIFSAWTLALKQSERRCIVSFSLLVIKGRPCLAAIWLAIARYSSCASQTWPQESALSAFSNWACHAARICSFSRAAMAIYGSGDSTHLFSKNSPPCWL
mmetsp:Transcript_60173/g.188983  ORF Transcript_60173/g.188983 Transcript_60173/m.188983 type:complete len:214 (-) Transcript_60173:1-642(-)